MKVQGMYDGEKVLLLESISLPPNTPVEVLLPEEPATISDSLAAAADTELVTLPTSPLATFVPVSVEGEPLSETIIRERR